MVAAVVVLAAGIGAATMMGRHGGASVLSARRGDTTSSVAAPTSTVPATTTTAAPVVVAPATSVPVASTRPVPRTTPTTAPKARATTTTTAVPVDQPACDSDYLVVAIGFDHPGTTPTYLPGQDVNATATLRNDGPGTCSVAGAGYGTSWTVHNAAGQPVGDAGGGLANGGPGGNIGIAVGVFGTQSAQWAPQCQNVPCAPGTYSLTFSWGLSPPTPGTGAVIFFTATADFQLVAAPP